MFKIDEHIYESNLPIKYVFEKSQNNKNFLVVAFSGFNAPNAANQKSYNYMRTMADIDCNKLFILDSYGPRGSYYIGEKLNLEFESSVQSLITYIARVCDVSPKNIICIGSSKGGSAALYYGLKYNYGYVISGAPQTYIADYISTVCPITTQYMLGDNHTEEIKEQLNQIIFKQLNKPILTNLHLFSSENDWQYKNHIKPLLEAFKEKNIACNTVIDNNMKSHGDIAKFFPAYLQKTLLSIMFGVESVDYKSSNNADSITVVVDVDMKKEAQNKTLTYLYSFKSNEGEFTRKIVNPKMTYTPKIPGAYTCAVTVLIDGIPAFTVNFGEKIITKNKFKLNGHNLEQKDSNLLFSINIEEHEKLQYAFYVYKNNEAIMKGTYDTAKQLEFPLQGSGKYSVTYFIKTENGEKIVGKSDILKVE